MPTHRYVVGLMFTKDGSRVLLIQKNRPVWQSGKLNGPGGKLEPDESFEDAMVREFREETGLDTFKDEWKHVLTWNGPDYELRFYSTQTDAVYDAKTTTDEHVRTYYTESMNQLPLVPNLKWIIPLCSDQSQIFPLTVQE